MNVLRHLFLFLLPLLHPLSASSAESLVTLIPLTIFNEYGKTWYEAIYFCYDNFQVRLASNDYSLKNLGNVIEEDVNSPQVWTGIFRRGVIDSKWRNQDGKVVNLNALQMTMCEEPVQGENCLSWKKWTPNERSCFQPRNCHERLDYYACEVLKIDFESEMPSRYEKLFPGWEISTGVLSDKSSLNFGPLVDHTIYEGEFDVEIRHEVDFTGKEEQANASSKYDDNYSAKCAYFEQSYKYWTTEYRSDAQKGYLEESIWFRFDTPLIVNKVSLETPTVYFGWSSYYPVYDTDKMSFFGSNSSNCGKHEDRWILSEDVILGDNSIDNHRKFSCYGIYTNTYRSVRYVALTYPIKYYEIKCQQNCHGKFASIFEKRKEMNFNTGGESNVHWEIYLYMSKSKYYNVDEVKNSISIGSNVYNHSIETWTVQKGNDTTLNMEYISNSKLIAIDDMIFKQDPINWSCDDGKFGTECQRECHCRNGGSCHVFSGHCNCEDGFYGPDCQGKISCSPLGGSSHGTFQCKKDENLVFGTTCELTCDDGYELLKKDLTSITCKQKIQNPEESYWDGWPKHLDRYSDFCDDINECAVKNKCNAQKCTNTPGDFNCDCGFDLVGKQCEINLRKEIEKPDNPSINCISGEKCQITVPKLSPSAIFFILKASPRSGNRRSTSIEEIVMFKDCESQAGDLPLFYYEEGDTYYSTINLQDGKVMNGPCQNVTSLEMGREYEIRFSIVTNVTNFLDGREFFWQNIKIVSAQTTTTTTTTITTIIVPVCVAVILILILSVVIFAVKRRGQKRKKDVDSQRAVYDYPSVTFDNFGNSTTGTNGTTATNENLSQRYLSQRIDFDKMEDNVTETDNIMEIEYDDASGLAPHDSLNVSTATYVSAAATANETATKTANVTFDEMEDNETDIDNVMENVYCNMSEYDIPISAAVDTSSTYTQRLPVRGAGTSSAIEITTPEPIGDTSSTYMQRLPTCQAR